MTGGGNSQLDRGRRKAVGGSAYQIFKNQPGNGVYRKVLKEFVARHDVRAIYDHHLGKVQRGGNSIVSITLDYAPMDPMGCPLPEPTRKGAATVRAKVNQLGRVGWSAVRQKGNSE